MATFLLVHGSWHGGWCWEKLAPRLQAAGHRAVAPDLPGHGDDPTPCAEVTLASYAKATCQAAAAQPEAVIAVGHSMGGIAISQAAERCPERFAALIYVCAFLPQDRQSLLDLSQSDPASLVARSLEFDAEGIQTTIRPEAVARLFYPDCTPEDIAWARARLGPDPLAPLRTPVSLSEARFGRIPRAYVECLSDLVVTPGFQRRMHSAVPCERVVSMASSHSPFLSAPDELAQHLISLAGISRG